MEFLDLEGKNEKDLVFDIFDMNGLEKTIFRELNDTRMTVKEIADSVDRNRSTVQRALQRMMDKDVILREGRTDKTVYYVYTTLPMEEIRDLARDAVDAWHERARKKLD